MIDHCNYLILGYIYYTIVIICYLVCIWLFLILVLLLEYHYLP